MALSFQEAEGCASIWYARTKKGLGIHLTPLQAIRPWRPEAVLRNDRWWLVAIALFEVKLHVFTITQMMRSPTI